jgi:hypothetical protein
LYCFVLDAVKIKFNPICASVEAKCEHRIVPMRFNLQGILAPIAASISLFGIYLLIKYVPDLSFQTFIDVYFFLLGSFAISSGAASLLKVTPSATACSVAQLLQYCVRFVRVANMQRARVRPHGKLPRLNMVAPQHDAETRLPFWPLLDSLHSKDVQSKLHPFSLDSYIQLEFRPLIVFHLNM